MSFKKNLPNIITSFRIFGTVCILFLRPLKLAYFIVYTATGVTDFLDGFVARITHTTSTFGAKLDSIADLLFYTIMLIKLLPVLVSVLQGYIWIIVGIILFFRALSYIVAAVKFHKFAANHTLLNKITGFLVFAVPYFLLTPYAGAYCLAVCISGALSTAEDLYIHISSSPCEDEAVA